MMLLTIYDIEDDAIRLKIAEACKDYGLQRIQFSAFLGDVSATRRDELFLRLRKTLGAYAGDIQMIPLCDKDLRLRKVIHIPKKDDPLYDATVVDS